MRKDSATSKLGLPPLVSPYSSLVFSVLAWIVFSKVYGGVDPAMLPGPTRGFLAIQPWWFVLSLACVAAKVAVEHVEAAKPWEGAARIGEGVLAVASVVCIGWGIVAMFVLALPAIP